MKTILPNVKIVFYTIWISTVGFFISYILNAYVANHVTVEVYGDFSLAMNFILTFSPIYLLGTDNTLIKYLTKYISNKNDKLAGHYLKWNLKIIIKSFLIFMPTLLLISAIIILLDYNQISLLEQYHLSVFFQIATPLVGLSFLIGTLFLALHRFIISTVIVKILQNASYLFLLFLLIYFRGDQSISRFEITLTVIIGSLIWLIISISAISLVSGHQIKEYFSTDFKKNVSLESEWAAYGKTLLLNSSVYVFIGFLDLFIIEIINHHGEKNVGYYAAMLTISNLLMVSMNAIKHTLKPILASHDNNKTKQKCLKLANIFQFSILTLITFISIVFSKNILGFFGSEYTNNSQLLNILMVGTAISYLPDLCIFDPLYGGYEKILLYKSIGYIILTSIISSLSYYFFSMPGMVWSIILIKNFINYSLFIYVRKRATLKYMYFC